MPDYHIFGGVFRSAVPLPELAPAAESDADWILRRVDPRNPDSELELLGREDVDTGVQVTLARLADGLRLTFDDTGIFDILDQGRRIDWIAPPTPDMDAVRKDILGRVMAVVLTLQGVTVLHGSAVAIGGQAVSFVAPKFHGKSTTATALVHAGGRLLADDLVPVTTEDIPRVRPSVPVVQLRTDSASRLGVSDAPATEPPRVPKVQVAWNGSDRLETRTVPLSAIYVLAPVGAASPEGVRRLRLNGVQAALALLGQSKIGALLGVERRAALLESLVKLSSRVPVFRLEVPRDFDRINEVTANLLGWHQPDAPADAPLGGSA